jgi:hypothetical protein
LIGGGTGTGAAPPTANLTGNTWPVVTLTFLVSAAAFTVWEPASTSTADDRGAVPT